MMELRKYRKCNECPRCGASEETTLHVLQCRSKEARKHWKKGIRRIEKWMRQSSTRTDVRIAIGAALWNFNRGENFDTYIPPTTSPELEECLNAQSRIGWLGFLEGFISPKWADIQEEHYKTQEKRRSGRRWAVELSKQLWKMVFSMFDHRNSALFTTSKIEELSGIQIVKNAIQQERSWGLGSLDPSYQPYLSLPLSSFLKMKSIDLRRWLCLIRQAREESGSVYNDEIASDNALRDWVGLDRKPQGSQHRTQGRKRKKQRKKLCFIRRGYMEQNT